MIIRIGTLNINNSRDVDRLSSLINGYHLDIFVLNECSSSLPSKLINKLNYNYNYVYSSADYCGNVIFSRYNIISHNDIILQNKSYSAEMRSASLIVVSLPINNQFIEIGFVGTHLSHVHESDRYEQILSLLDNVLLFYYLFMLYLFYSFILCNFRFLIQLLLLEI